MTVPPGVPAATPVSQRFRGTVTRVADGTAFLTIVDGGGHRSFASYDAQQLQALGIAEGSDFTCSLSVGRGKAELVFTPTPKEPLPSEQVKQIWERIDAVLGDDDPTDDD